MESSIDSRITTAVKLLGKWRTDGRRVHCRFVNNWEGWQVDGVDSLDFAEINGGSLVVGFADWQLSLSLEKIEEVSVTDSRLPDGMSSPTSGPEEVAYISDKSVLIRIKKADDAGSPHSFLSFSAILDQNHLARA
jgi:hypothetical protein